MENSCCDTQDIRVFLLQIPSSHETRAIRMAAMLLDGFQTLNTDVARLSEHIQSLSKGSCVPVGSVEFVREAMRLANFREPLSNPYHPSLEPWFKRNIKKCSVSQIMDRCFVKPVQTKLFNGFVFNPLENPAERDEHDQAQHSVLTSLPLTTDVWMAEPVTFVSEWRYYVDQGAILGSARYDDGPEDAPTPNGEEVIAAAETAAQALGHGFALDMGVLDDGETALVEVNDAWATGLYGNCIPPKAYALWLLNRWSKIACS